METYLFKFSACLTIFWFVYILFLERQTMHRFKRFYLLAAVASALIIPVLTITHYIEPIVTGFEVSPILIPMETSFAEIPQVQTPFMDLETGLWMVYGLGVLLFSLRFVVNLFKMYKRISDNETLTKHSFIYVLLEECRIPHSFFKYLFFDRSKYETNTIPEEVKLHEETHAKQLHSLDIIVIELLQIVFWFHPLIYILKHHIKLNHEFLADQAVLDQGSDTKTYQNILLQFSSNTQEYQLSSAINYSSIKKRFTVMKTQTSKTRIWLSTLLLLPIIAILFYSFAEREYVEKVMLPSSHSINNHYARSIDLKILNDNSYQVDGINATKKTFKDVFNQLHQDITPEERNRIMNIHVSSPNEISNKEIWFVYNSLQDYGFYRIVTPNQEINRVKGNTPFAIENSLSTHQNEPTVKEISAYNAWAKKIHAESKVLSNNATFYPPINEQDLIKFSAIHKRMSTKQKNQSIEFPFPGLDVKDSENSFPLVAKNKQQKATKKQIAEYNTWAKKINTAVAKAEANKNLNTYPIIKKKEVEKYKRVYGSMTTEQKKNAEPFPQIPPPPPPPSTKASKTKGLKKALNNSVDDINQKTIKPIEIDIKKNNNLVLNGKAIEFKNLVSAVGKLNQHLTIEERRNYVEASIRVENNKSLDFAKKVQKELRKIDIYLVGIGFNQNIEKSGLTLKHVNLNAGLTIAEAKAQNEKLMNDYKENKNNTSKNSPWKIAVGEEVEILDSSQMKSGPIEINGATYYFTQQNGKTTYFDRYGKAVDINKIPPPPPIPINATPEEKAEMQKATDAYKMAKLNNGETPDELTGYTEINGEKLYYVSKNGETTYFNQYGKEVKMDNLPPPPPAPESTLDFVIRMAKANAKFINDGEVISSDKAIELIKKNPKLKVSAQKTDTKQPLVYFFEKPRVKTVKGKN